MFAPGQGRLQRGEGVVFAQVPQEAQDQRTAQAQRPLSLLPGPCQPLDHRAHGNAAGRVGLRVEEHLGMHHTIGSRLTEIGHRHIEEVLLLQQHRRPGVVEVQEALQVGEGVGLTKRLHAGVRQVHAVASCQRKDQLGLERALDMDVQFGLGHALQQAGQTVRGDAFQGQRFHQVLP